MHSGRRIYIKYKKCEVYLKMITIKQLQQMRLLLGRVCLRCGHKWIIKIKEKQTQTEEPTICPSCKTPYWNKQKRQTCVLCNTLRNLEHKLDDILVCSDCFDRARTKNAE